MKKLIYILIGVTAILSSCSTIDDDERLIYVKPADVARKVLIEDFTGQRCVNCPWGTEEIEAIQNTYGADNVIAVGIHSGPLGFHGNERVLGLATDLGDAYYTYWGIEYQPQGLVNRTGRLNYTDWQAKVSEEIQKTASLNIGLQADYDADTKKVNITVNTLGTNGATNGKLQLWVIEDDITAMQMMPDGSANAAYLHKHAFRDAVNGTWGDDFTLAEGETKTSIYTLTLDDAWVPEHVSIVAFVYNDSGVQQVEKIAVVQPEEAVSEEETAEEELSD